MNEGFFERLELELRAAADRPARRLPSMRGAPAAVAAVAVLAIAVAAVLALVGGGERRATGDRQAQRPTFPNETVVASGVAPVAGRWEMLAYRSERLADPDSGEEYQPAGLRCLGLTLVDPPGDVPSGFGGQCGEFPRTPGFSRIQTTVPTIGGEVREVLVYGRAPERAAHVRLSAPGKRPIQVTPVEGPPSARGDFYLIAVRPKQLRKARVNWIDARGNEGSRGIRVTPP